MKPQNKPTKTENKLLQKAEILFSERKKEHPEIAFIEFGKLIRELELHQIELELQNEELNNCKGKGRVC